MIEVVPTMYFEIKWLIDILIVYQYMYSALEIYPVLQWSKVLSVQASFLKIWLEINWYNLQVALILQTFDACFKETHTGHFVPYNIFTASK